MRTASHCALLVSAALACGCSKAKTADEDKPPTGKITSGAAEPAPAPVVAPKPEHKYATPEAKLQRYAECWKAFNAGNYDVFASCFAADAVREQVDSVPALVAQGAEKITEMAKEQRASFPDLKVTPELVIVSGDDIAALIHVGGTNTADVAGMKASGKKLGVYEAEIGSMNADGTFTHDSIYVDQLTIYHQLGLLENDTSPKASDPYATEPVTLTSHGDATELANKAIVERIMEAVNKKNAKAIEAVAADNIKLVEHADKQNVSGKRAYAKWLHDTLHSTKDGFVDIKGLWTGGDYVVVSYVFSGTPSDEVIGKQAEPKRIESHVVEFLRFHDGKLAEQQSFENRLEPEVQLGIVDPDELMQTISKPANDSGKPAAHDPHDASRRR